MVVGEKMWVQTELLIQLSKEGGRGYGPLSLDAQVISRRRIGEA